MRAADKADETEAGLAGRFPRDPTGPCLLIIVNMLLLYDFLH